MNSKYRILGAAALFALSACEKPVQETPPVVVEDPDTTAEDECPRADGQPCK